MIELNRDEQIIVNGGYFKEAFYSALQKAVEDAYKKIIMVYCIGQELKKGIEHVDLYSVAGAGICMTTSFFVSEFPKNLVKKSKTD